MTSCAGASTQVHGSLVGILRVAKDTLSQDDKGSAVEAAPP